MKQTLVRLHPAGCQRRSRQRAFTLVELIVVMVLAGILAYGGMLQLGNIADVNAHGFAEQMASAVRYAQKASIAQRRTVYVNIVSSAPQLFVCLDSAVPCASPLTQAAGGNLSLSSGSGVTVSSSVAQFSFSIAGIPSLASTLQVSVSSSSGKVFHVTINADSGYVQLS